MHTLAHTCTSSVSTLGTQVVVQVPWMQEDCASSQQLRQLPTMTHLHVQFLLNLSQLKHADTTNNEQDHNCIVSRVGLLLQPEAAQPTLQQGANGGHCMVQPWNGLLPQYALCMSKPMLTILSARHVSMLPSGLHIDRVQNRAC